MKLSFLEKLLKIVKRGEEEGEEEEYEEEEEEETVEEASTVSAPRVIGVISSKGGTGKSIIAASMVIAVSALEGPVLLVDMDIHNNSSTLRVLGCGGAETISMYRNDAEDISVLKYLVEGVGESGITLYKVEYPRNSIPSIQVAGKPDEGVPVKTIYLLPASPQSPARRRMLEEVLIRMKRSEIRESMQELYRAILEFAAQHRVKRVIFDFPPFIGVKSSAVEPTILTEYMMDASFLAVITHDPETVRGIVSLLTGPYVYIRPRLIGMIINQVPRKNLKDVKEAEEYIKSYIGTPIYRIRYDPYWRIDTTWGVPIIYQDPSKGASRDFFAAMCKLGILTRDRIRELLGFDPCI